MLNVTNFIMLSLYIAVVVITKIKLKNGDTYIV